MKSWMLFFVCSVLIWFLVGCKKDNPPTPGHSENPDNTCFSAGKASNHLFQIHDTLKFSWNSSTSKSIDFDQDGEDDISFLHEVKSFPDTTARRKLYLMSLHPDIELISELRMDSIFYYEYSYSNVGITYVDSVYEKYYSCGRSVQHALFDSVYVGRLLIPLNKGDCFEDYSKAQSSSIPLLINGHNTYSSFKYRGTVLINQDFTVQHYDYDQFPCNAFEPMKPAFIGFYLKRIKKYGWIKIKPLGGYALLMQSYAIQD